MSMSFDDFCQHLSDAIHAETSLVAKSNDCIAWLVPDNGADIVCLRAMVRDHTAGKYRNYCPVTFVCHALTGKYYDVIDAKDAGNAIGLSDDLHRLIISAADYPENAMCSGAEPIRERLVAIINNMFMSKQDLPEPDLILTKGST